MKQIYKYNINTTVEMEKKNLIIGAGVTIGILGAVGLFYYLSKEDTKEPDLDFVTKEEIYEILERELADIKKPAKESHGGKTSEGSISAYIYPKDFTLKLYYLLSKYATWIKKSLNDKNFEERIAKLKEGDHQGRLFYWILGRRKISEF